MLVVVAKQGQAGFGAFLLGVIVCVGLIVSLVLFLCGSGCGWFLGSYVGTAFDTF